MNLLPRCAPLALLLSAAPLIAQTPADPSKPAEKKHLPAEIPAPKAAEPAKSAEPPPTSSLSPGSRQPDSGKNAPANPIDSLPAADLDQIQSLLKAHFLLPAEISDLEIKRATVQGLLERLSPKASVITTAPPGSAELGPFRSEVIDSRVGYVRLGTIDAENLTQLDAALEGFSEKKLPATVLDLRATPQGTNFDPAAEVCRRFCPKGKILFTVRQPNSKDQIYTSKDEPRYHGILIVLESSETAGNGEVIAGVLRNLAQALVIGQKTKGEAAGFEEYPLSGSTVLRVPVTEFILPGAAESITTGIQPDVPVDVSPATTKDVLKQELEKGVEPLVKEAERARLNEAALVAGTNPDLDALIAQQQAHGGQAKVPLHDAVLQRALDLVSSIAVYEKGSRVR